MNEKCFSWALRELKIGNGITRKGWNGKGLYVELQKPDANSKMTRPYLYLVSPPGSSSQFGDPTVTPEHRVPWVPSQTDLLANDWESL